ncbi:cell filamentation protein Fic [Catenovulum agarivorans DS-2]|uniref:protein adenylyltransferase n=1 Tax=Catenovulum agarivorans DS-2 TaxID=1328313 RepID=W7QBH0_9ALTE|nr:Fic family protein [Catenovulum agarivorans]EWH10144.1 cell filamentation protein Fic [Catenovulum agarivorans DS-2]
MRDKYGVSQDSYCYLNSDVLINKLNITTQDKLSDAELEFTAYRYSQYTSKITSLTEFNFSHLKYLHLHLFQDVYQWAGEIRTVDISKGNTRFCSCLRIEAEANKQLARIQTLDPTQSHFFQEITDIFCELNVIHPFREGNGRTQRFFFEELFFYLGYNVAWPDISKEEWIEANIKGYHGDLGALCDILNSATANHSQL